MLEQARARAAEAGVELELRELDMRDLELEEPAALIYCRIAAAPSSVSPPLLDPRLGSSTRRGYGGGRRVRGGCPPVAPGCWHLTPPVQK